MGAISNPGSSSSIVIPSKTVNSATYQLLSTDLGTKITFTSACTVTLLDPAAATTPTNFHCWFTNASGDVVGLVRKNAETIFGPGNSATGTTTLDMTSPCSGYHIETNGTNWFAVSSVSSSSAPATSGQASGIGKNFIINGAMNVDQRFVGTANTPAVSSTYTLDRFMARFSQASKFSIQQVADAPAGFLNSMKFTVIAQTAPGAADFFNVGQNVEGINCIPLALGTASATNQAISFWAKTSVPATYSFSISNAANDRSYVFSKQVTATWTKFTQTLIGDTAGTWLTTVGGVGLRLFIDLGAGVNSQVAAQGWNAAQNFEITGAAQFVNQVNGTTYNITGVTLEAAQNSSPFVIEQMSETMTKCQRYFWKSFQYSDKPGQGTIGGAGALAYFVPVAGVSLTGFTVRHPVEMAGVPTKTYYSTNSANTTWRNLTIPADSGAGQTSLNGKSATTISNPQVIGDLVGHMLAIHATFDAEI